MHREEDCNLSHLMERGEPKAAEAPLPHRGNRFLLHPFLNAGLPPFGLEWVGSDGWRMA